MEYILVSQCKWFPAPFPRSQEESWDPWQAMACTSIVKRCLYIDVSLEFNFCANIDLYRRVDLQTCSRCWFTARCRRNVSDGGKLTSS